MFPEISPLAVEICPFVVDRFPVKPISPPHVISLEVSNSKHSIIPAGAVKPPRVISTLPVSNTKLPVDSIFPTTSKPASTNKLFFVVKSLQIIAPVFPEICKLANEPVIVC